MLKVLSSESLYLYLCIHIQRVAYVSYVTSCGSFLFKSKVPNPLFVRSKSKFEIRMQIEDADYRLQLVRYSCTVSVNQCVITSICRWKIQSVSYKVNGKRYMLRSGVECLCCGDGDGIWDLKLKFHGLRTLFQLQPQHSTIWKGNVQLPSIQHIVLGLFNSKYFSF